MFATLVLAGACPRPVDTPRDAAVAVEDAVVPSPPAEYPAAWVGEELGARPGKCAALVYKDGCRVLRKGRVNVRVVLDGEGGVVSVDVESNTVKVDPELVEACVRKDLTGRRFRAPLPGMVRTFRHTVVLGDRC
jgi:hypothetical protein